jgi:hypothetical protein
MTTYSEMVIIVPDEACTMRVKCGINTMLIETLSDYNREYCNRFGQHPGFAAARSAGHARFGPGHRGPGR